MVEHNPAKYDPDMPHHEHYAMEGRTKMYRPKKHDLNEGLLRTLRKEGIKEHELGYWEGKDHS